MKKSISIPVFLLLFISLTINAQEEFPPSSESPPEGMEIVEDDFQEYFFEALKQKAIENYQLAIDALQKAGNFARDNQEKAVVFFEMGKNYFQLKEYSAAEENYNKALKLTGDRLDILEHVYDVFYHQQDYQKALVTVQKLIAFDSAYKEDLANLYVHTEQYDNALELLDSLETEWGISETRSALKARIYKITGNAEGAIADLEQKTETHPQNENEFLNLIFLYSEQGQTDKAFETAKNLLAANPNSRLVHLALYKFYLEENEAEKAIGSMKIVFSTEEIDRETKYRVLSDFISFVIKNPKYEEELDDVVDLFSEKQSEIYNQLGNYFLSQHRKEDALRFYEEGYSKDPDNFNMLTNMILLQLEVENYSQAEKASRQGLELFPAQAILYLLNGVANNGLEKPEKAIESLESGLDFVFDNPKMEQDFYKQLNSAYKKSGNSEKAAIFEKKANEIKIEN